MNLLISFILIISIDTLRYDALESMPLTGKHLHRFQQVESCWTPVPLTLPAHISMLSGRYPYEHGIRNNGHYRLKDETVYLPQLLHERGYRTAAFVSAQVLSAKYGLQRGFDVYHEPPIGFKEQPAETTIAHCLEFMKQEGVNDRPTLVFLHLYDPHAPYRGHDRAAPNSRAAYYAEVTHVDQQLQQIWSFLDEQNRWGSTLVVLTSDHGEDLGDHGEFQHGLYLYDTTTRVPFFLHAPAERTLRQTGSLVDLAPTILDYLGIEKPMEMTGTSLTDPDSKTCIIESLAAYELMRWPKMYGLVEGGWKYIEGDGLELYKLDQGGETQNLAEEFPDRVRQCKTRLDPVKLASRETPRGDPELLALGYLSPVSDGEIRTIKRSDQRRVLEALHNSFLDLDTGNFEGIWDGVMNALDADRSNPALHFYLLTAALRLNKQLPEDLINSIKPDYDNSGSTAYMLGQYLEKQGFKEKASNYYEQAQEQNPLFIEPSLALMILALTSGRPDEARPQVELLLRYGAQEEAGILAEAVWRMYQGNPHYALLFLDKVEQKLQSSVRYWLIKGYIQSSQKKNESALVSFQRAHELGYISPEFILGWATIALEINDLVQARRLFAEFLERYPRHKEAVNVKEILAAYPQN
ncbi:sulfatase-like hydrolase/transferase [bacterium]|nr:sulfatase-like hydrolase/transferase [bacterium]